MAVLMMQNTIIDGSLTTEPQKPHRHSLPFIVADFRKYPMPKKETMSKNGMSWKTLGFYMKFIYIEYLIYCVSCANLRSVYRRLQILQLTK